MNYEEKPLLMKHCLLFIFLLNLSLSAKAQRIKTDSAFYDNGNPYWKSYRNNSLPGQMNVVIEYFYEDGKNKVTQLTDSLFTTSSMLQFWLPDGTQLVKDGNGKYIEIDHDSTVYTVANGKYNGPAEKYKYHFRYKAGTHLWKLFGTGNYESGYKNGMWDFLDTSGYKKATVNYVKDTAFGKCILYYPGCNKIKAEGSLMNCLQDGEWKYYDENGNLSCLANYRSGIKTGEYAEYYTNGKIKTKGQYIQSNKILRTPVEDPHSPGTFKLQKRKLVVACKTGEWFYYDKNGTLQKKRKFKNEFEPPANYEETVYRHKKYYDLDLRIVSDIPDCNYY